MKKILVIGGVLLAVIALIVFNKMTSKRGITESFTEVKKGVFEISVTNSGELIAEKSIEVKGPEIVMGSQGGGGHDMRGMDFKIQDIVPEGTIVKEGDYIAQLDRSSYSNTLKDEIETLKTYQKRRAYLNGRFFYFYVLIVTAGVSLYTVEVLEGKSLLTKLTYDTLCAAYIIFCTFYLKDRIIKNENEKVSLMIDRLERLQGQFE